MAEAGRSVAHHNGSREFRKPHAVPMLSHRLTGFHFAKNRNGIEWCRHAGASLGSMHSVGWSLLIGSAIQRSGTETVWSHEIVLASKASLRS